MADCICPRFEKAIQLLAKKWSGLIIHVLLNRDCRFRDIRDQIPQMSERMLTERLKELESHHLLTRHVYAESPIRVVYQLTEKGRSLAPVIHSIQTWADHWIDLSDESI